MIVLLKANIFDEYVMLNQKAVLQNRRNIEAFSGKTIAWAERRSLHSFLTLLQSLQS